MNIQSKLTLLFIIILSIFSVAATYYNYVVDRNFTIIDDTEEDVSYGVDNNLQLYI